MIDERRAKLYCKEDISKIENYDKAIADTTQTWHCHHRTEIWWNCTRKELIENECYYNRKACELIFLTPAEHKSLHHKGKHFSAEFRKKMSKANKGKILTEETKQNIAKAMKGKTNRKGKTTSIFGKAFKEHYGMTKCDNKKLYTKENNYFKYHGKFSWS